ncbi:MAG: hypothetical protein WCZ28_10540 [Burkholderiaceae bacterium]
MNEALEIAAWMLLVALIAMAMPLVWSWMRDHKRDRKAGGHRRPLRIRETDPDDAYTC